jgi:lysozyme
MKLDSNPRYPTRWFDAPPQAVELAKRFEGFHRVQRGDPGRAHPYTCWGATGPSDTVGSAIANTQRSSIIEAEAEACLGEDLRTALDGTLRFCPILAAETEARLAAIVDFTFNLGAGRLQTSTPRQRVNEGDWVAAQTEIKRWFFGGGKVLPGLVARREAEAALLEG